MIAVVIVPWPGYARVVRSLVLTFRNSSTSLPRRACSPPLTRASSSATSCPMHGPTLVLATLQIGDTILSLSGLSFLGLGSRPPSPEWGTMVADGARTFDQWWIGMFPGWQS